MIQYDKERRNSAIRSITMVYEMILGIIILITMIMSCAWCMVDSECCTAYGRRESFDAPDAPAPPDVVIIVSPMTT